LAPLLSSLAMLALGGTVNRPKPHYYLGNSHQ
jgi:hypothetical protein